MYKYKGRQTGGHVVENSETLEPIIRVTLSILIAHGQCEESMKSVGGPPKRPLVEPETNKEWNL